MRKPFYVRCYAKRSDGQWVAVCVDLCLAAQADSFAEAKQKLGAQIRDYVFEAFTVDRAHARELLSRKAPIQNRLEYLAIRCLELAPGVFHSKRSGRKQRAFEELVSVPA